MKNAKQNRLSYAATFSLLGIVAYFLTASLANLPLEIDNMLSYLCGSLFFIVALNIIGFSVIKFSNWIGMYMTQRWKMILLYACMATFLLLLNYGLLIAAKMIAGINEPYLFPNGGKRIIILVWLVELIVMGLMIVNRSVVHAMTIQKEAARLREENNKARYVALQNQLNPHFLFNSLNTLISEIEYDPKNAVLFTRNLSDAYRYVLQTQNKSLVTLREELEFMQSYIFLHRVRLGNYINVECQISENYLDAQLPPLTLQLLVENVIKHNTITASKPMEISIAITDSTLVVSNSVNYKKSADTTGTGLQNLSNRCLLMLGKDLSIVKDDKLFTVKIPLLYE
ncbi:MAG: histidine kinase [Bacteroides sp.]